MTAILVPLDGSALAERALPLAVSLARATGQELRLVEALTLPFSVEPMAFDGLEAAAAGYVGAQAASTQRDCGLVTSAATPFGDAALVILGEAGSGAVSCIVMTTHGREGLRRAVLGSVAEHVLRRSPVPVWLLPAAAQGRERAAIKDILVPLDGSALSESVLPAVTELARGLVARITLVHISEPPKHAVFTEQGRLISSIDQEVDRALLEGVQYLQPLANRLRAAGIEATPVAELGHDPAARALELAAQGGADLIAMATHGRGGLDRLRHGSVTEHVLRHSHLPVLAFGPAALREAAGSKAGGRGGNVTLRPVPSGA